MGTIFLKACPNESCPRYGKRFTAFRLCVECGSTLKPVAQCCEQEAIDDTGFCGACGTAKRLRFLGSMVVAP